MRNTNDKALPKGHENSVPSLDFLRASLGQDLQVVTRCAQMDKPMFQVSETGETWLNAAAVDEALRLMRIFADELKEHLG